MQFYKTILSLAPTASAQNLSFQCPSYPNSLKITFESVAADSVHGDLLNYLLWYKLTTLGSVAVTSAWVTVVVHPSLTSFELKNLQYGGEYEVKIQAVNQYGGGVFSSTVLGGKYYLHLFA